jgi:hypothetical protein
MATTKVSSQFSVNWHDIKKGLLTAAFTPIFSIVMPLLQKGDFKFDWKQILGTAIAGCLSYISLMFFMPAKIYVKDASQQDMKDVQSGDKQVKLIKT